MKLRKALEKARQERENNPGSAGPAADEASSPRPGAGGGWSPPVYSQSARVEIDPACLAQNRCVGLTPDAEEMEAYKILRTRIQLRLRQMGGNTLMITSAFPGEGKSLTAVNLALTFARDFNQTVLLVDCDLKQQSIHRYLGCRNTRGIADYFIQDKPLKDLIVWPGVEKLTLISGGEVIADSAELLQSPRMAALIEEMRTRYKDRFIIFDVPPVLASADAISFAPFMDAVVMVVEEGKTPIPDIKKAVGMLPQDKLLGFVLNKQRAPANGYRYYYRYRK